MYKHVFPAILCCKGQRLHLAHSNPSSNSNEIYKSPKPQVKQKMAHILDGQVSLSYQNILKNVRSQYFPVNIV